MMVRRRSLEREVKVGDLPRNPSGVRRPRPFGKPTLLFKDNATKRMSGRFWPDEKSIFFVVDGDIFNAVRSSTVVAFPDGAAIPGVKTVGLEYGPFISKDGKSLYFNASEWGVLRLAQRENTAEDFAKPEDIVGLRPYPDAPYLAGDDDVLYYDADDENLAKHHIWRAELSDSGFADNEIQIAENADFKPFSPVVSRDELTMYFAANGAATGVDIKLVTRESRDVAFGDPQDVPSVNVPGAFNRPTWLSDDRCRLVIESAQTLYLAVKTK